MTGSLLVVAAALGAIVSAQSALVPDSQHALVKRYCAGCHNDKLKTGGFSWAKIDLSHPEQNTEQTEKVIRMIRAGMMPPSGMPRPDASTLKAFAGSLEESIDRAVAASPYAGSPDLHRLNRTEYRNSVRDILGIDVDVTTMLPPDEMSHGFDNVADALSITPALMDGYIRAASKISREAIGDPHASPQMASFTVPKVVNQMHHIDGTPSGTRGGIAVTHDFPADGDYVFKVAFYYDYLETLFGQTLPPNLQGQQIEISIDGARAAIFTINPNIPETKNLLQTQPIKITAGTHKLAAAFIAKFDGPIEDEFRQVEQSMNDISAGLPGLTALPHLHTLSVTGPMNISGVSDTASREKIFSCHPEKTSDELPCAKKIIAALARQAYRRPVNEQDLETLLNHYQHGRNEGGFESGIRMALQGILASPEFVFRFEQVPSNAAPGSNYRITNLELASRLSYFLWSSAPDEQLIALASQGKLRNPKVLEQQVRRMLADPRAEALSENFAYQWLHLQNLKNSEPDVMLFGNFTRNLAQSMTRETELLFDSIVREDRGVVDLLTANYTFLNEDLSKHYGTREVFGADFKRVTLTDPNRFGLLGQGSILTLTSVANRTSPVQRGKYVMEVFLGTPPPVPPPNVPPLKENVRNEKAQTVRERMEEHRANEPCHSCHQLMDPIGLSLENFDAVGVWRNNDSGLPVDANGKMFDGTSLNGPVSLRAAILNHTESYLGTFTENLLAYAVGRVLDYRDMPAVRSIEREAAKSDNRFSAIVLGIVKSVPFEMRKADEAEAPTAAAPANEH